MTDEGYFPRGRSVLRRVHQQRAVGLLYGQRALAIGATAPLNFIGTQAHTRSPDKPFQRLARTGKAFETIFFGTRAEADEVLARVRRMHEQVEGTIERDAGTFRAGTPYSALDPELMLWTVAVIADSAQFFYELFIRRLSPDEREALWQDYLLFGELFGLPRSAAPRSYGEFRDYYDARLAGDYAHLTDEARYVGGAIMFEIPVPSSRAPAMRLHNLILLGSLPPRVRRMYRLGWSAAHAVAFRGAVAALKAPRPVTPAAIRRGRNTAFFDSVASAERSRIERGQPIAGALA